MYKYLTNINVSEVNRTNIVQISYKYHFVRTKLYKFLTNIILSEVLIVQISYKYHFVRNKSYKYLTNIILSEVKCTNILQIQFCQNSGESPRAAEVHEEHKEEQPGARVYFTSCLIYIFTSTCFKFLNIKKPPILHLTFYILLLTLYILLLKLRSNELEARCFLEYDRLYVDHKCYIWNDVLGQVRQLTVGEGAQ